MKGMCEKRAGATHTLPYQHFLAAMWRKRTLNTRRMKRVLPSSTPGLDFEGHRNASAGSKLLSTALHRRRVLSSISSFLSFPFLLPSSLSSSSFPPFLFFFILRKSSGPDLNDRTRHWRRLGRVGCRHPQRVGCCFTSELSSSRVSKLLSKTFPT